MVNTEIERRKYLYSSIVQIRPLDQPLGLSLGYTFYLRIIFYNIYPHAIKMKCYACVVITIMFICQNFYF